MGSSRQAQIMKDVQERKIDESLFVAAESEIVHLLDRDKFASFKLSSPFQKFLDDTGGYSSPFSSSVGNDTQHDRSKIRRGGSVIYRRRLRTSGRYTRNTWSPAPKVR